MARVQCRFYEQKFPEVDDVVMVNVRSIAEMGAYVTLSEYNNIEGMILLSELSRRRIRSIQKLIRVGRSECVVVLRVDKEKVPSSSCCLQTHDKNLPAHLLILKACKATRFLFETRSFLLHFDINSPYYPPSIALIILLLYREVDIS